MGGQSEKNILIFKKFLQAGTVVHHRFSTFTNSSVTRHCPFASCDLNDTINHFKQVSTVFRDVNLIWRLDWEWLKAGIFEKKPQRWLSYSINREKIEKKTVCLPNTSWDFINPVGKVTLTALNKTPDYRQDWLEILLHLRAISKNLSTGIFLSTLFQLMSWMYTVEPLWKSPLGQNRGYIVK